MGEEPHNTLGQVLHKLALQIAIDGPAGSGKSTIACELASALGCTFLDTGLMYRAVTHLALSRQVPLDNEDAVVALADSTSFETPGSSQDSILVNGTSMDSCLRSPTIDAFVSAVSAMPRVRSSLVQRQRDLARDTCIIMVGRDIGTVVLPHADVKLWVTASAHARARRRFDEGLSPAGETVEMVQEKIEARDRTDTHRAASPLTRPRDAIDINTDGATVSESVHQALDIVRQTVERLTVEPGKRER